MKGNELKTFLLKKGVTGRDLAQKMKTTPQNISYMLNYSTKKGEKLSSLPVPSIMLKTQLCKDSFSLRIYQVKML